MIIKKGLGDTLGHFYDYKLEGTCHTVISRHNNNLKKMSQKTLLPLMMNTQHSFNPKISQCLYLMVLGKTIKEISYDLQLSHRTVEEYIVKLKNIYSCTSKSQILTRLLSIPENRSRIADFIMRFP